ncbi:MAG: hypothetical protein A4E49_03083 [Methanosaeta sp. PtaU1.Bin112]|nr:MAG: hypothetical protein A4E49_03083 [Methanosaeta sp. PtaU1.Bin112]
MKYLAIFTIFLCIAGLCMAADYTDQQKAVMQGLRLSYQLGEAHQKYVSGGDATTLNSIIDQWNSWVQSNFGPDPNLLMAKVTGPADLSKPYVSANNTTAGIVHKIDGNRWQNKTYTTNDANLLPQSALDSWRKSNPGMGDGYLSGV